MREPLVNIRTVISEDRPYAVLEMLNFQDDPLGYGRVWGLTLSEGGYKYHIAAPDIDEPTARSLSRELPKPGPALDGVVGTLAVLNARYAASEDAPGLHLVGDAYIRIDVKGDSVCEAGDIYAAAQLGKQGCVGIRDQDFPEHALRRHVLVAAEAQAAAAAGAPRP